MGNAVAKRWQLPTGRQAELNRWTECKPCMAASEAHLWSRCTWADCSTCPKTATSFRWWPQSASPRQRGLCSKPKSTRAHYEIVTLDHFQYTPGSSYIFCTSFLLSLIIYLRWTYFQHLDRGSQLPMHPHVWVRTSSKRFACMPPSK